MLTTTQLFKNKIVAPERFMNPIVEVDFRPDEIIFVTGATASSSAVGTQAGDVTQMLFTPQGWASTGSYLSNIRKNKGWQGTVISNELGWVSEWLSLTYSRVMTFHSLYFVSYDGYHPEDFTIEARINNVWQIIHTEVGNKDELWGINLSEEIKADAIRINITRIPTVGNNVKLLTFGFPHKILLNQDGIEDFRTLEEIAGESSSPLGSVTANEVSVTLKNDHKWFTPANTDSPFQAYLKPGVKIKPFIGIETSLDVFEIVPLGVYYTTDWNIPIESVSAALVALDRIHLLSQRPPVKIPIIPNATISQLFDLLFRANGLNATEYEIDSSLNQKIAIGWVPKGTFGEAAQLLSEAGNCSVLVTRTGKVVVKNNFVIGDSLGSLTDQESITSISNPMSFLKTYNAVRVKYKIPSIKADTELLSVKGLIFPPGKTLLKDLEFNAGPVVKIQSIKLTTPPGVLKVNAVSNGAWYVDLEIENTSWEPVEGNLIIDGTNVELVSTEFTSKQTGVPAHAVRTFEFENDLIQDTTVAMRYAQALRAVLEQPALFYKASTRGNPSYELFDLLTVESAVDGIKPTDILSTRFEVTYDGGFEILIEGKKPVVPRIKVFLSTGFWIEVPLPISERYYT
jgi:hypothetical protein